MKQNLRFRACHCPRLPIITQLLSTIILLFFAARLLAQQPFQVRGKITSMTDGAPLSGVAISSKKAGTSATSTENGSFSITSTVQDTLVFTYMGHERLEIPLSGNARLDVALTQQRNALDEVLVIGYGTTTRRLSTGSVGKISAETISQQPVTNVMSALSGRIPGVFVQTTNGLPGGGVRIEVRGRQSIAAGNDPLYVVDGIPFVSTSLNTDIENLNFLNGAVSPLNSLSPGDIASIEVLKDADATAIYGARGANGVILITTKKGRDRATSISVNMDQGISRAGRKADFLGLGDYLMLRREAFDNEGAIPSPDPSSMGYAPDLAVWDTTRYTDWQDYVLGGTAGLTRLQASFSGGTDRTRFLFGLSHHGEGSVLPGDQRYNRYGGHVGIEHRDGKFSFQSTVSYTRDGNRTLKALEVLNIASLPPNFSAYLPDGSLNWELGYNPEAYLAQPATNHSGNLMASYALGYELLEGLLLRANAGYTALSMDSWSAQPASSQNPNYGATANNANFGRQGTTVLLAEPQIHYTKGKGPDQFGALLGFSWQRSHRSSEHVFATDYPNEYTLENLGFAGSIGSFGNTANEYRYTSVFARLSYNHGGRYLVNANLRRDGSSRFGPDNRFGNFGALGAAWVFSEEPFFRDILGSAVNFGKLRGSYGIVGNDQIPDHQYLATYASSSAYLGMGTLRPSVISNADYRWEVTKKLEGGLEMGFLDGRIQGSVAHFRHRSDNQLVAYPIPYTSGPFGSYQANMPALVSNTGWELELSGIPVQGNSFSWNGTFNITLPRNELVSYPGLELSSYATLYTVGEDLSNLQGYGYLGIDPETGIATFRDLNGDGVISYSNDDRVARGRTSPDFYGGFGNDMKYKGFGLSIFFQFVKQQAAINPYLYHPPGSLSSNKLGTALNRWRAPEDETDIQRAYLASNSQAIQAMSNLSYSNAIIGDASYIRLKNIALKYALPPGFASRLHIKGLEVTGLAQNLLTWTPFSDIDPEVANGIISGAPVLRSFTLGLNIHI